MTLVRPVRARLVTSPWAARVVSPLHDVLTESERRAVLADNPDSYLHVTSDPLALPGTLGDAPADAAQARALRRLLDQGAYRCLPEPSAFVYRMREGGDEHTGVVASVGLAGFADGRVLGHERVQSARVEGLVRHYDRVTMRSELVALFHRAEPAVAAADGPGPPGAGPARVHRCRGRRAVGVAGPARGVGRPDAAAGPATALHRGRSSPGRRRSPLLGA